MSFARSIFSVISRSRAAASTGLEQGLSCENLLELHGTYLAAPNGLGFVEVADAGVASPDFGLLIGVLESPPPRGSRSSFRRVGGPFWPGVGEHVSMTFHALSSNTDWASSPSVLVQILWPEEVREQTF